MVLEFVGVCMQVQSWRELVRVVGDIAVSRSLGYTETPPHLDPLFHRAAARPSDPQRGRDRGSGWPCGGAGGDRLGLLQRRHQRGEGRARAGSLRVVCWI